MKTVLSRNTSHLRGRSARRCSRAVAAGLLGSTILAGAAAPVAVAAVADDDLVDVTGLVAVTDESLDRMRGGFSVGPFNINFGLVIRTAINHQQVLMTSFKIETLGKIEDLKHEWQTYLHDSNPAWGSGGSSGNSHGNSGSNAQAAATPPSQNPSGGGLADTLQGALDHPPTQETAQQVGTQTGQEVAGEVINQAANAGTGPAAPNTPDPASAGAKAEPAPIAESRVDLGGGFNVTQIPGGIIVDNGAGTAVMHQLDSGLASTIVNIANGATVSQSTEMNIFVTNFSNVIGQHAAFQATRDMAFELVRNNPLLGQ